MIRAWHHAFIVFALLPTALSASAGGDPQKGAKTYRICAGCHSLEPGRHSAGPSLARIFGRKAGAVTGFTRYSKALKESDVVWNEKTLDTWIKNPDALIPDNLMPFPGISDPIARANLVAFLKSVSAKNEPAHDRRNPPLNRAPPAAPFNLEGE